MSEIRYSDDLVWIHLHSCDCSEQHMKSLTGKYQYFCSDRDVLLQIAEHEMSKYGFFHAKISILNKSHGDYFMALYWLEDSRKAELRKRSYEYIRKFGTEVKFRGWKSNEATRRGEYSDYFLNQ